MRYDPWAGLRRFVGRTGVAGRQQREHRLSVIVTLPPELGVHAPKRFALGGMAELFRGEKHFPKGGKARLVVKHMLPQHAEVPELVSRFRDEARLGLLLRHSNIARVLEYWEIQGHHYMLMEEIEGFNLSSVIHECYDQRIDIPQEVVAFFLHGIASALAYMADARGADGANLGLVHRDISPSNVLVSHDGVVRLIDFGVAKADQRETQTRTGYFVGKFAYMSPEQIRGDEVDVRSDLFSLGSVAYEMLLGQRPFQGASEYETFNLVLNSDPAPITDYRPEIHPKLLHAVERCLSKEPEDRYVHPILLVEDLLDYFHGAVERPPPLLATQFLGQLGMVPAADPVELDLASASGASHRGPSLLTPTPQAAAPSTATVANLADPLTATEPVSSPTLAGQVPGEPRTERKRRRSLLWLVGGSLSLVALLLLGAGAGGWGAWQWIDWAALLDAAGGVAAPTPAGEDEAFGDPADESLEAIITDADPEDIDIEPADASEGRVPAATGELPGDAAPGDDAGQGEQPTAAPAAEATRPAIVRTGTLVVRSRPYAEIWIDGTPYYRTPVEIPDLPVGTHQLQASNEGLNWMHKESVQIRAGKTTEIRLSPQPAEPTEPAE
jgi:eukaryotic-like serine/threonine-protein kinase